MDVVTNIARTNWLFGYYFNFNISVSYRSNYWFIIELESTLGHLISPDLNYRQIIKEKLEQKVCRKHKSPGVKPQQSDRSERPLAFLERVEGAALGSKWTTRMLASSFSAQAGNCSSVATASPHANFPTSHVTVYPKITGTRCPNLPGFFIFKFQNIRHFNLSSTEYKCIFLKNFNSEIITRNINSNLFWLLTMKKKK